LPAKDNPEQAIIVQAVKTWLQTHQGWLLVLDSADEPDQFTAFLPPVAGGHLLLTTRARVLRHLGIARPQRALATRERILGPEHPETMRGLNNLAALYYVQGKYQEAESLYQRALEIRERILGPEHPDTACSLNNLAALYDVQDKYQEAEPLYQ